jgi:hypothetical protein
LSTYANASTKSYYRVTQSDGINRVHPNTKFIGANAMRRLNVAYVYQRENLFDRQFQGHFHALKAIVNEGEGHFPVMWGFRQYAPGRS